MNVLHLDEQLGWRGGEQQASWLIQGLAQRGHRNVLVGRARGPFLQHAHGGAAAVRMAVPLANELDVYSIARIARLVQRERVDVLHAHSSHAHLLACLAAKAAGRGRVVVSRRVSFAPKSNRLNRWKYRLPDMYLAVSGKVAEVLREYGIEENRIRRVYSSIDLKRLQVTPADRRRLGVAAAQPLLFSAGALVGHKDHATLVEAFAQVHKAAPEAVLCIAGEGPLRSDLEAQIRRHGLQDAVRLLGHREDVPALMHAADVYVSSSWSEGLGTSVLEALACATPVVATVAGGIPEMVRNGETGRLTPARVPEALADAIIEALGDPEGSAALAARGKQVVEERFSVRQMVEGTLRAYEEVLA